MDEMILQSTLAHQKMMRNEAIKEYKLRSLRGIRQPDLKQILLNLSVVSLVVLWSIA